MYGTSPLVADFVVDKLSKTAQIGIAPDLKPNHPGLHSKVVRSVYGSTIVTV